jgi:hypothetical protein
MPDGHTDSEEIFRYMDAAMAIARSCIYMPSALVERSQGIQVFYACPQKCSITTKGIEHYWVGRYIDDEGHGELID